MGHDLVKIAETEAGLEAAYKIVCQTKGEIQPNDEIARAMKEVDRKFPLELREEGVLLEADKELVLVSE